MGKRHNPKVNLSVTEYSRPGTSAVFDDLLHILRGKNQGSGHGETQIESISSLQDWQFKRGALKDLFKFSLGNRPAIDCPLDPKVIFERKEAEYLLRKIEFTSEPDDRVGAYILIPHGAKAMAPAVICIPPTVDACKDETAGLVPTAYGKDHAYAAHLARRGFVTITYDLVQAGERMTPGYKPYVTEPFYKKHPDWSIRGKDIWDVGRAIDVLLTLPEVDPQRIGCIGHSLGACIGVHAAAVDERIKSTVSNCGWYPARLAKNPLLRARLEYWCDCPPLRPFAYCGKPFPTDLHEHLAMIAPRSVLALSPVNDEGYKLSEQHITKPTFENLIGNVNKIFALYDVADNYKHILHDKGHCMLEPEQELAYRFLKETLKAN